MTRKIDVSLISANNISSNSILVVQNSNVIYSGITTLIPAGQSITIDANGRINSVYQDSNVYSNVMLLSLATNANVNLKANVTDLTTANITELSNLYFTNTRAYANTLTAIKTGNGIIYDNTTGNITLSTSGVTSGTYGGLDFFIPVVTVDTYGRVTSASYIIAPYSIVNASEVSGGVNLRQRIVINASSYLAAESNIKLASGSGLSITRNNDNEIFITTAGDGTFSNVTTSHSANVSNITLANQYLKINSLGSVSGATTINLTLGNMVTATATGAVQWTVTGLQGSSGYGSVFILELTNGGVGTQTWMSGIRWPSGTPPTLQASGVDVLAFFTDDNGSNWRGVLNMSNSS